MGAYLITGDDDSLVLDALGDLLRDLVGSGDRSLVVDDFDGDDYELGAAVDAARTPALFGDARVVVARGIGRFNTADLEPLLSFVREPVGSNHLVLVGGGGRIPKALTDALRAGGATILNTAPPTRARERDGWFEAQLAAAGVAVEPAAAARIAQWLGEDVGRLRGVLDTLRATYGGDRRLGVDEVDPFLGEAGGVPPWDLTDAIDAARTPRALEVLARMTGAGARHPLQVMSILHGHYARLLALDGADVHDEASAAAAMGIKPGFPARKAWETYRRLGPDAVRSAVGLLAAADLDLRGARDWPEDLVMEVLVARLSRLAARRR